MTTQREEGKEKWQDNKIENKRWKSDEK